MISSTVSNSHELNIIWTELHQAHIQLWVQQLTAVNTFTRIKQLAFRKLLTTLRLH
jgi:hypothetical protein